MPTDRQGTKIQTRNRAVIRAGALEVFSTFGYRGATLDHIAAETGLSKPNLLYYFASKEAIYLDVLGNILETWLDPLEDLKADGEPLEEIMGYVRRKLFMSRDYPRESRLFANEMLQGAPNIQSILVGRLKPLVDEKCVVIQKWIEAGQIADVHPYHLIFSVWSLTQHYADFEMQVQAVLGDGDPYDSAEQYLVKVFSKILTPN